MSMSRFQIRNRSIWSSRGRQVPEDWYRLDPNRSVIENAFEIYRELSTSTATESRRLSLLSAFVKLLEEDKYAAPSNSATNTGGSNIVAAFTVEEYMYCLSASLVHPFTQIRAAALRAIRHLLRLPSHMVAFNELQLPHLVCRSLDVLLDNEEERVQALKLIRKILAVAPTLISPIIVRSLVSLGDSVAEDGDRMLRACLAVLCELGVLHPTVLIMCGGVSAITRNVLECHSPRIAESLVGVLLHLLERPSTRQMAGVRLDCLAAPYCDFTYRLGIMDKNKDARDLRFTSSRLALLSVLRSWAGTIEFCDPNKPSGLKAIVDVLYLNQLEVRRAILDLLYELLWLPQPTWTDEYSVALAVIDPADYQDSWRLAEGFVWMEGRCVLPSLAPRVPNISELHTAILLYCFLETGLLNALVEVVVTGDTFISVRATVLIGKLLQLMHTHLPADILNTSSALPTLVAHATKGNHQAKGAISALQTLHQMLKNRPAACSLFLDSIIQSGTILNSKIFRRDIDPNAEIPDIGLLLDQSRGIGDTMITTLTPDTSRMSEASMYGPARRNRMDSVGSSASGDERPSTVLSVNSTLRRFSQKRIRMRQFYDNLKQNERLMRDSNVLQMADGQTWDWEIIVAILRTEAVHKMDDNQCRFIRQLVHYFKPSSNRFSHQELGHGRNVPAFVTAGLELIDWLLQSQALECIRLLTDLFSDINTHLNAILNTRSVHDCLFSPQHMNSTMCQHYFLFIGRMCRNQKGLGILNNTDIFEKLSKIVTSTIHLCYIKLIVSGLDYAYDELPRTILQQAMMGTERRAARLYATEFMVVLLRARIINFEVWGLPLLIKQTKDSNRVVALAALTILDEAAHDRTYLEEMVNLWPRFEQLGDVGCLFMTRYYSIPRGLNHTNARIAQRIEQWVKVFNKKYVLLQEADTHSVLTLHTKNEDGAYNRRSCSSRPAVIPPNLLAHMYGQLVQTTQGLANLIKYGNLAQMCDVLALARCTTDAESLALKEAIWALSHASSSRIGLKHVTDLDSTMVNKLIVLAKHCAVYSIRANAFQALCLIGSTKVGADLLYTLDWICVRHDRNTLWPICEPEDWLTKHLQPVRHTLDEVPPYNYTSIDDNISTMRFPHVENPLEDSSTTTFFCDETSSEPNTEAAYNADLDVRLAAVNASMATTPSAAAARSRTLPEGVASHTPSNIHKHTRSLSESKTTDGISLMGTTNRTRFNSGTDSNTSGVSSCESVYARYMFMSDLHHHTNTLSPIPSSSNLLDVKSNTATTDRIRRMSQTGASYQENTLSPQDAQGWAQLRKLRSYQRPMLSESAADELADFMNPSSAIGVTPNRMSTSSSVLTAHEQQQQNRRLKVRSLDRHSKLMIGLEDIRSISSTVKSSDDNAPCYSGICLPKNILDLFNTAATNDTYVTQFSHDTEIQTRLHHRNGRTAHAPEAPSSSYSALDAFSEDDQLPGSISSLSDASSATAATTNKRSFAKWSSAKHNRSACLLCCRQSLSFRASSSDTPDGSSAASVYITRRRNSSQTDGFSLNRTPSINEEHPPATEPLSAATADAPNDRITDTILHQVQRMANPVWGKQAKMALLELKQKHPTAYQDICLYAEVCRALSNNTYRLYARRFLQELFLDLNFDSFLAVAAEIFVRREREAIQQGGLDTVDSGGGRKAASSGASSGHVRLSTAHFNGGGFSAPTTGPAIPSSVTASSMGTAMSATDHIYLTVKTQLRHPQLASVFETSVENLAESLGSRGKQLLTSTSSKLAGSDFETTVMPVGQRRNHMATSYIIAHRHSDIPHSHTDEPPPSTTSSTASVVSEPNVVSNHLSSSSSIGTNRPMRPRINTLELDLSCTKNKFPITDRRKQIQQMIRDKNPNSAPATPNEWSFQLARKADDHGFLATTAPPATANTISPAPIPILNGKPTQTAALTQSITTAMAATTLT